MWIAAWIACQPERAPPPEGADPDAPCGPAFQPTDLADAVAGHRLDLVAHQPAWAEPRDLPVHLWYPTDATTGAPVSYLGFFDDPASLGDAPFADPGCRSPLAVYSHGDQAWAGNGTDLLRQLVRSGFIAAGPDHVGNTLADNVDPRPVGFDRTRVADIQAVIDHLADLPADHPLHGRVDTERVLVLGHSYGGQTAWLFSGPTFDAAAIDAACAEHPNGCSDAERAAFDAPIDDPRVRGVIALDGAAGTDVIAASGWATRHTPVLYLSQASTGAADAYARAAGDGVTWVQITGACHESFTSTPLACDLPKEEGLSIVADWTTAWTGHALFGLNDAAAVLSGETLIDPRTIVTP
jgi:pimeloyl-ACP methyl ester carboxylesterase